MTARRMQFFHFADVAGPWVPGEGAQAFLIEGEADFAGLGGEALEEELGEEAGRPSSRSRRGGRVIWTTARR